MKKYFDDMRHLFNWGGKPKEKLLIFENYLLPRDIFGRAEHL